MHGDGAVDEAFVRREAIVIGAGQWSIFEKLFPVLDGWRRTDDQYSRYLI
jgi:hypothetical protein